MARRGVPVNLIEMFLTEEDEAGEEKAHLCDVGNDLELLVCKAAFTAAQATLGLLSKKLMSSVLSFNAWARMTF